MLLKVNYFASDRGKSLHSIFIEIKMGLFYVCMRIPQNLFSNDFVYSLSFNSFLFNLVLQAL